MAYFSGHSVYGVAHRRCSFRPIYSLIGVVRHTTVASHSEVNVTTIDRTMSLCLVCCAIHFY